MSFYIQQYRNNSNHWSPIETTQGDIETTIDYFISNKYKDRFINPKNTTLEKGEKYFLSVDIERMGSGITEKEITIKLLKNTDSTIFSSENQYIDTIILPKKEIIGEELVNTSSFNFIITPNDTYQRIAFILSRDLTNANDIDLTANIDVKMFAKLNNLIGNGINVSGSNINITQIGIHARPGTLMCINGEPIKIGKRGVFELNSVFRLQQQTHLQDSQDSTTITPVSQPETVGISFLNIINYENGKETKEYYTIDYRYVKIEEAT